MRVRRHLLALLTLLTPLIAAAPAPAATQAATASDMQTTTPIKHFVTLMQENHSFDNYFGTYPGADGIPEGTCMPVNPDLPGSRCIEPHHIGGKAVKDLSHSSFTATLQRNGGRMDGFVDAIRVQTGEVEPSVMGYYDDRDLPYYWNVADEYVLFDRFFTSSRGGSVSNHMYWVAGQAGVEDLRREAIPEQGFELETIFDRLEEAGVSWKFYVQNYDPTITFRSRVTGHRGSQIVWVPLLAMPRYLDDPELFRNIVPLEEFYEDVAEGTLPAVSYIVPSGSSEHPPGSLTAGETMVRTMINSLMRSDLWESSAFIWTYDDWGGWYDHVKPPRVDGFGYGFRAPALLVSPYARRGHIESETLDFTSILKFIEENWRLPPLASRDRKAKSIAGAFDFSQEPRAALFLDRERGVAAQEEPRRAAVYVAYAAAALAFLALLVIASRRRLAGRRRFAAPAEEPGA